MFAYSNTHTKILVSAHKVEQFWQAINHGSMGDAT